MSKTEINEIFIDEIDNFVSSWESLNESKNKLKTYSKFIQKLLDIINTYFMKYTELKTSFPKKLYSSINNDLEDDPIKRIGYFLLSFIENHLGNLSNLLKIPNQYYSH